MNLLHDGADPNSIALWLGHASSKSTDIYLHADMAIKEKALALLAPTPAAGRRYRPGDSFSRSSKACSYADPIRSCARLTSDNITPHDRARHNRTVGIRITIPTRRRSRGAP
jgi:hypothetical protein